jgi:DNA ligase-1
VERFGSVRAVEPGLVLEVEFDAVQRSTRHKSGVALRFPRLQRIRWDKPAGEASTLPELLSLLPAGD